jgi:hypothetical protein
MKKTLALLVLILAVQSAQMQRAHAQEGAVEAVEAVVKVSKLTKLKNMIPKADPRFVAAMVVMYPLGWLTGEVAMPHAIKGLCWLEAKTVGKQKLMPKQQSCELYYGNPMLNSCQVSDNSVALMFPNPADKKTAIRFVGTFDQTKLTSVRQMIVVPDEKAQSFKALSVPVEVFYDAKGMVFEYKPDPRGFVMADAATEDDKAALDFYNEVGAVMRSAKSECKEGMYDQTMKQIMSQKPGKH